MYIEKKVLVEDIIYEDEEIQILKTSDGAKKALSYLTITPRASKNEEIIVNVTSTMLKLGTGGMDIVTSVIGSMPVNKVIPEGHIMKSRYLPSQHSVLTVEAQESIYHDLFKEPFSLEGKKVLIGELHSMIPICFWAMDFLNRGGRMVVIVSDEASIPLSLSSHIRALKNDERFSTITIGQAFGGTYEAVNLPTALQFATKVLKADLIFVTLGPGVVGSNTRYGYSGIVQASWANIISSLEGLPVWVPRLSESDKRERHQGISHHTITPMVEFTYAKCILPLPIVIGSIGNKINKQIEELQLKHTIRWLQREPLEELVLHGLKNSTVPIQTMGRKYEDDPIFFLGVAGAIKWVFD